MSYPTPSDYQEAVQDPANAFADAELQNATPRENVLGLPQPITGAFAAVFPMTTESGIRYAAKCFLSDVPRQQRRYAAVSEHLASASLRWTVPFDYQPRGIRVNGTAYPLLKMQWARGSSLNRFVEKHLDEPSLLLALAGEWVQMCRDLEANNIAHGDLQHGNVQVERDDGVDIRLVDYDTMYVPALSGGTSTEVGHRNYQHPDRTDEDFGPALDRFSALAIYTGICACAERPELWQAYNSGENLLFRDGDFYDPDASPLFRDILAVDALAPLAEALRTACYVEPESVPPLSAVVDGQASFDNASVQRSRRDRDDARPKARRDTFEWWWALALCLALAACIGVGVWTRPVIGAMGAVACIVAAVAAAGMRYQRRPAVRRDRRLVREADRITRLIDNIRRQITSLEAKREEVLASVDRQREDRLQEIREEVIYDHLKHHFIGELRGVEGMTHKHVVWLKSANIRTAYEATQSRVADIRRLSDQTKARIAMWRATLLREAEDEMPDELSPAEERRLRRYVEHRVSDMDAEIRRAKEKIEVQSTEREEINARREALPGLSFGRYLGYLLFLASPPARLEAPPAPPAPSKKTGEANAEALSEPVSSDAPWWQQET